MIAITPEGDLVAGLDTEHVAKVLRDDDLPFGANLVSHTRQYDSPGKDRNTLTP